MLSPALGNQIRVRMKARLGGKRINVDFVLAVFDLVLPILSRRRAFMSRGCGHMTESYQPSIQMLMMTPAHFHDATQCATNKQLKDIVVVVGSCCEKSHSRSATAFVVEDANRDSTFFSWFDKAFDKGG